MKWLKELLCKHQYKTIRTQDANWFYGKRIFTDAVVWTEECAMCGKVVRELAGASSDELWKLKKEGRKLP